MIDDQEKNIFNFSESSKYGSPKHMFIFTESEEVIKDLKNNNLNLNNLNLKFSKLVTKSKISKRLTEEEMHICKRIIFNR